MTDAYLEIPAGNSVCFSFGNLPEWEGIDVKKAFDGNFISVPRVNLLTTHPVEPDKRSPQVKRVLIFNLFKLVPREQLEFSSLLNTHESTQLIFWGSVSTNDEQCC